MSNKPRKNGFLIIVLISLILGVLFGMRNQIADRYQHAMNERQFIENLRKVQERQRSEGIPKEWVRKDETYDEYLERMKQIEETVRRNHEKWLKRIEKERATEGN